MVIPDNGNSDIKTFETFFYRHRFLLLTIGFTLSFLLGLASLSYACAPDKIVAISGGQDLISYSDFFVTGADMENTIAEDHLYLHSFSTQDPPGHTGFDAKMSTEGLEAVVVDFTLKVPGDYYDEDAYNILVDLYTEGYDFGEQEFTVMPNRGTTHIHRTIPVGDAPEVVKFRFFTQAEGPFVIENLHVRPGRFVPQSGAAPWLGILAVACLALSILGLVRVRKLAALPENANGSTSDVNSIRDDSTGVTGRPLLAAYAGAILLSILIIYWEFGGVIPGFTDSGAFYAKQDMAQHYLGWKAYLMYGEGWPLGMFDALSYPFRNSVVFSDSVPLMAVFFKFLSPILPAGFQYLSLWNVLCRVLMAVAAVRCLKPHYKSPVPLVLAAGFMCMTGTLFMRSFGHDALAAQGLLVLGWDLLLHYERYKQQKRLTLAALFLGALAASIHVYLLLMVGILLAGTCLMDLLCTRKIRGTLGMLAAYVASGGLMLYICGGFAVPAEMNSDGLSVYSMNLNSLFNPMEMSSFVGMAHLYDSRQYEGQVYLGIAGILLVLTAIGMGIVPWIRRSRQPDKAGQEPMIPTAEKSTLRAARIMAIWAVCLICLILALSPVATLGATKIYQLYLPESILRIWGIFRSTGRIGWVLQYGILLAALMALGKRCRPVLLSAILVAACLLQTVEFSGWHAEERVDKLGGAAYGIETEEVSYGMTETAFWDDLAADDSLELVVFTEHFMRFHAKLGMEITNWTLDHGKKQNDFYFARTPRGDIQAFLEQRLNTPQGNEIFLFLPKDSGKCVQEGYHYYEVDGIIVGVPREVEGYAERLQVE